jgi:hypothetical protein
MTTFRPHRKKLVAAKDFVLDALSDGERPAREVKAAADAAGISAMVLWRAVRNLPIISQPPKGVRNGPWVWKLRRQATISPRVERIAVAPRGSRARREQPQSASAMSDPLERLANPIGFRPLVDGAEKNRPTMICHR